MEKKYPQQPERYATQVATFQGIGGTYYVAVHILAIMVRFTNSYIQGTLAILISSFIGYWLGLRVFRQAKEAATGNMEKGSMMPWTWAWGIIWTAANWGGYTLLCMLLQTIWWVAVLIMVVALVVAVLFTPVIFRVIMRRQKNGIQLAHDLPGVIGF